MVKRPQDKQKLSQGMLYRKERIMYFVYELVDPRTDVTGYVGITNNPNKRYYEHLEGNDKNEKKREWIARLQAEKLQPKMKILEIVDNIKQARNQERYWIQYYVSKGVELKNTKIYEKEYKTAGKDSSFSTDDCYTARQVKEILDIDHLTFVTFIHKGAITNAFPDRQSHVGYYLKSDVDKLAADLEAFRKRYGPEGFIPQTIFRK